MNDQTRRPGPAEDAPAGEPDPLRPERFAAAEAETGPDGDPGLAAAAEAGRGVDAADVVSGRQPAAKRARRAARRAALAAEAADLSAEAERAGEPVAPPPPGEAEAAPVAGEPVPDSAAEPKSGEIVAPRPRAAARQARKRRRKAKLGKARALRGKGGGGGARGKGGALVEAKAANVPDVAPRPSISVEAPASGAARRARRRALVSRIAVWGSFVALVAAPTAIAGWYLYAKAADQYASEVSFAVRSLDGALPSPVMELFGGGGDSTTGDTQMLFEYLQSQPMVERVDDRLALREIYNRPEADPVFALGDAETIEELLDYWNRAVTVSYDSTAGIIDVEVRAFRPGDAKRVAEAVLDESETLINGLSTGARADAVRFAEIDLAEAEQRVRDARLALQSFREAQGTADVAGDITQEMGLIAQLRARRAEIEGDIESRRSVLSSDSPVLEAMERRLAAVDAQIATAEARIADGEIDPGGAGSLSATPRGTLAEAAGVQERLQVELEFATNMYTSAQSALEAARAEARRQQRYLATHIAPTLSQEPRYPERLFWTVGIFGVALLSWAILLLITSSIRDRS
ncbi:MAG TPA: hypothetical protein VJ994_13080 [Paracoccaceae bacterium]|nr:hypothetical protein [Paracoccaceae bacterium]